MSQLHTYKSYIEYLSAEAQKRQLDDLSVGILRTNGQVAELQAENDVLKANQFPKEPICEECRKPRRCLGIMWARHAKPCK